MAETVIRFDGLAAVIVEGEHPTGARVILLDPRSIGGPTHDACFVTNIQPEGAGVPDRAFYSVDGTALGLWDLSGATVRFVSSEPFDTVLKPAEISEHGPPNHDWSNLCWLPDYYGASRATGLADEAGWSWQAKVEIGWGRLRAKAPSGPAREVFSFRSADGSRTEVTAPRPFSQLVELAFSERVVVAITTCRGNRTIVLEPGSTAVISNTSAVVGPDHEDAAIMRLLQSSTPVQRFTRPVDTHSGGIVDKENIRIDPDRCKPGLIYIPPRPKQE